MIHVAENIHWTEYSYTQVGWSPLKVVEGIGVEPINLNCGKYSLDWIRSAPCRIPSEIGEQIIVYCTSELDNNLP